MIVKKLTSRWTRAHLIYRHPFPSCEVKWRHLTIRNYGIGSGYRSPRGGFCSPQDLHGIVYSYVARSTKEGVLHGLFSTCPTSLIEVLPTIIIERVVTCYHHCRGISRSYQQEASSVPIAVLLAASADLPVSRKKVMKGQLKMMDESTTEALTLAAIQRSLGESREVARSVPGR